MLSFLISILAVLIVGGLLYWLVQMLPLPPQIKQIALVVVVLILIVWLLQILGVFGPPWRVHLR